MEETTLMYGLYIVYYILFPVGFILLLNEILSKRDYLENLKSYGEERTKKNKKAIDETEADFKKLQVMLVVFILLLIPAVNFTFYGLQEITIDRARIYHGGFSSTLYSPLERQIGPTTDIDSVLREMEESTDREPWYLEDIKEEIDFDDLTRFPGRLAVYYLRKRDTGMEHIVITYNYFSPLPITRVYGFNIFHDSAHLAEEDTIVYPLNPSGVDPF